MSDSMYVSTAIKTKRAVRQYNDTPLPSETIHAILNAGRRAQSSKNSQPWRFIAIQDGDTLKALAETGTYASHLAGATLGVAILTLDPAQRFSIMFDAGQAAAYMQLAAWELGLGSCLATIYDPEKVRQLLGYPQEWHIRIALSFGYPLDQDALDSPSQKGGRLTMEEVVHWERW